MRGLAGGILTRNILPAPAPAATATGPRGQQPRLMRRHETGPISLFHNALLTRMRTRGKTPSGGVFLPMRGNLTPGSHAQPHSVTRRHTAVRARLPGSHPCKREVSADSPQAILFFSSIPLLRLETASFDAPDATPQQIYRRVYPCAYRHSRRGT